MVALRLFLPMEIWDIQIGSYRHVYNMFYYDCGIELLEQYL